MHTNLRVAIVGVTGFIGHGLPALLSEKSIRTTGISRSENNSVPGVDRWQTPDQMDFSGHCAVINLAGEAIDRRWTDSAKQKFHESRVGVTTRIVESIAKLPEDDRPKVLVNASAVGYYGDRGDDILSEDARPGTGYLAELCSDWESAARRAESLGLARELRGLNLIRARRRPHRGTRGPGGIGIGQLRRAHAKGIARLAERLERSLERRQAVLQGAERRAFLRTRRLLRAQPVLRGAFRVHQLVNEASPIEARSQSC